MVHFRKLVLRDVWRTCNKIRAAIFRTKNLNLYDFFRPLDPNGNCVVTEAEFISVFANQLRNAIGLNDEEITDLADYFKIQDGRVLYTQLCDVVQKSPDFSQHEDLVSGLEWEDPLHVNTLSKSEERRLCLLITKIATIVNMRRLVMRPYFQDYELISKNVGTVTISHFARILAFLNILVSPTDFNILVKKYLKNSYTLNYVAFLKDIDNAVKYMEQHGMLDVGGNLLSLFPGRVLNAELPKLVRPEIGKTNVSSIFGTQSIFHPILSGPVEKESLVTVIKRIQRYVLENRIRIKDFFEDFDTLHTGRCTVAQFRRAIDRIGIGKSGRLYISPPDLDSLIIQYRDPLDPNLVFYRTFERDIETVFATRGLEKAPMFQQQTPQEILEMPRHGSKDWQTVLPDRKDLCELALDKIKVKISARGIMLKPFFRDYDKHNNGHVSRAQMRQVFARSGILLGNSEIYALEERYNDDVGFNYGWFLQEISAKKIEEPLYNNYVEQMRNLNAPKPKPEAKQHETNIIKVLAKVKAHIVRNRVDTLAFLQDFDKHNEHVISGTDFKRGLSAAQLGLTDTECDTLIKIFASAQRPGSVDYRRFVSVIEEAFTQDYLERSPLVVPVQHIPSKDCDRNFLNFEERHVLSMAMQKLATKPDMTHNLMSLFQDYDKVNCGSVTKSQFMSVLALRDLMVLISTPEFDVVCKSFSCERGLRNEVDYRSFCKALDLLYQTSKSLPF